MAAYPGTVRVWTTKVDLININYADDINELQDEVSAIQSILAVNPQGTYATVKAWLQDLSAHINDGVTDHGGLTGLSDDDHGQYLNNTRHDDTGRHVYGASAAYGVRVPASDLAPTGSSDTVKRGSANTPAAADHRHEIGSAVLSEVIGWQTGDVKCSARSTPQAGWALCDGASQSRTDPTYAPLFAAIGTTYGAADSTHFTIPDFQGRSPMGAGNGPFLSNRTRGQLLGVEEHEINLFELPLHHHDIDNHVHGVPGPAVTKFGVLEPGGSEAFQLCPGTYTVSIVPNTASVGLTTEDGGGVAHPAAIGLLHPVIVVNWFIKL